MHYLWCDVKHCEIGTDICELELKLTGRWCVFWDACECMWRNYILLCHPAGWNRCFCLALFASFLRYADAWLVVSPNIDTECTGYTFHVLESLPWMHLSVIEFQIWTSTTKFSTTSNQKGRLQLSSCTIRKSIPSEEMHYFVAEWRRGDCLFLKQKSHFCLKQAPMMRLCPALYLRDIFVEGSAYSWCWILRLRCELTSKEVSNQ